MSWIKVRKALFYFIYSIVIAIFAVELLLRFFLPVMSTGTSTGIGAKWYEMYWQPINTSRNYRLLNELYVKGDAHGSNGNERLSLDF